VIQLDAARPDYPEHPDLDARRSRHPRCDARPQCHASRTGVERRSCPPYLDGRRRLLNGSAYPDQWLIAGNHRDAWVFGGVDSVERIDRADGAGAQAFGALANSGAPEANNRARQLGRTKSTQ
jgi:hypothetical protein